MVHGRGEVSLLGGCRLNHTQMDRPTQMRRGRSDAGTHLVLGDLLEEVAGEDAQEGPSQVQGLEHRAVRGRAWWVKGAGGRRGRRW